MRFAVSGLVVAAFGAFVFGLYLRRWVKERRAGAAGLGAREAAV